MRQIGFTDTQINRLKAAYSFGKSQFLGIPKIKLDDVINDPEIAAKIIQELIGDSRIEKGCLLIINTKHQLIQRQVFSVGTETECLVNPRTVFEIVLRHGGTRFIFAHNHPSGSLDPSPEDLEITEQLINGSKLMDIPLLDHLIVSRDRFKSLRQFTSLWN
jgi:DNA repair protein RadC